VLGLDLGRASPGDRPLPAGAAELLAARDKARAAKDFARSDELREELRALGVSVSDRPLKS
jgi:cysteinyl-tRNA synthetase